MTRPVFQALQFQGWSLPVSTAPRIPQAGRATTLRATLLGGEYLLVLLDWGEARSRDRGIQCIDESFPCFDVCKFRASCCRSRWRWRSSWRWMVGAMSILVLDISLLETDRFGCHRALKSRVMERLWRGYGRGPGTSHSRSVNQLEPVPYPSRLPQCQKISSQQQERQNTKSTPPPPNPSSKRLSKGFSKVSSN